MPAGPSSGSARMPRRSGPRPRHCAISFSTSGRILSRASAPASASSGSPGPMEATGLKLLPRARSTSARAPTARSNPFSPTTSTAVPHTGPRTELRSSTPTSAGRATTIRRTDVLTHPTLDQLHALGLHGMAKAFVDIQASGEAASLGHAEWLALLLEREASLRHDKRLSARLRYAKLRQQACVEDIDYRTPRGLDRALFAQLAEGSWIDAHANLLICGPAGVAGRHQRLLRALGRVDLLILDDWGLEPLDAAARHDLLEILEDRYGCRSTIVTSQLPVDQWHALIGDPTYADAVLDRLVHNAHRLGLTGESLRRTRAQQAAHKA